MVLSTVSPEDISEAGDDFLSKAIVPVVTLDEAVYSTFPSEYGSGIVYKMGAVSKTKQYNTKEKG